MKNPLPIRPLALVTSCVALACGTSPALGAEERLPVIARMQVVFSMVSHYSHIPERVAFYNTYGSPQGNTNYAVPHLVYEPNVTLYNPYDTALEIPRSRVQLRNPPVGFRFLKKDISHTAYLRPEWANGAFSGLGRFQIQNELNANVQKFFTLILGGGDSEDFSGTITLLPGESRTFHVRVENNWTWGLETQGGYVARSFHDWDANTNLTNFDYRTGNVFGAEAISCGSQPDDYPDFRAGFQTDLLSLSSGRPLASKYPFESSRNYGGPWVAIKKTDSVIVEAKGMRTVVNAASPDFVLSLMRGNTTNLTADTVHDFPFKVADLIGPEPATPVISRIFAVGDILQAPQDHTKGGKTPFAAFTIVAKASALKQGLFLNVPKYPSSLVTSQLYETHLDEVTSFSEVGGIGPSDGLESGMVVSGVERVDDTLILDVASQPGVPLGRVMGTTDPRLGFPDDLTASCEITAGPVGTGLFKVTVPVAGLGERYFVRIER